ncbi:MAG TPA: TolC family outer membrane protein [Usitatibacteraceae bacterium]
MNPRIAPLLIATLIVGISANPASAANLLDIYRDAKAQDPVYASSRASAEAGKEAYPQARAGLLPNLSLSGAYNRNERETTGIPKFDYNSKSYTLSLTQPLFRMQNWIAAAQADWQVKQTDAVFADAEQNLILRAAQAYFDVLLAQDNVALSGAQKTAFSEQLAQAKRNFEVGTATIVDTYDSQARYDLAVAREISDQNDLEIKMRALQQLIGKFPASLSPLKDGVSLALPQPANMDEWVKSAEDSSPVIAQFRAAYEIATREVTRNKAGHLPTLDLVGSYSDSRSPNITTLGATGPELSTKATQIGLQLTFPLFQGGGTQSRIRQALSLREKAEQDLENTKRTVAQNVRQNYLGVTNGVAQVKAFEAALVSSKSSLDSTILGREVGVRTNVDILNAQQQLFQARRDLQQARYNTILSQLKLKSAVGRLEEEDVAEVNRLLTN